MDTREPDFRNAGFSRSDGRAGGARNGCNHRAKARRSAEWMSMVKSGEKKRKRGKGSLARKAERRRAAMRSDDESKTEDDHYDSEDSQSSGYLTAEEDDVADVFWPGGPALGHRPLLPMDTVSLRSWPVGSKTAEGLPGRDSKGTQSEAQVRDQACQTLRRLTSLGQCNVRLQTDVSFEEMDRACKARMDKAGGLIEEQWHLAESNVQRKMSDLASAVQENATTQVHKQLRREIRDVTHAVGEARKEIASWLGLIEKGGCYHCYRGKSARAYTVRPERVDEVEQALLALEQELQSMVQQARARVEDEGGCELRCTRDTQTDVEPEGLFDRAEWRIASLEEQLRAAEGRTAAAQAKVEEERRRRRGLTHKVQEQAELLSAAGRSKILLEHQAEVDAIDFQIEQRRVEREQVCRELRQANKELEQLQKLIDLTDFVQQRQRLSACLMQEGLLLPTGDFTVSSCEIMRNAARDCAELEMRAVSGGCTLCTYSQADQKVFEAKVANDMGELKKESEEAKLRRECRGMVVGPLGEIVARPLHKFFSEGQVCDSQMKWIGGLEVVEATEKVDGIMVYGVLIEGVMQLWTRAGYTSIARDINRWAVEMGALGSNIFGLLEEVERRGCTAIFEWVGRQAKIKVKETETKLVLTQIRDKQTGEYWSHRAVLEAAQHYSVLCVRSLPRYEGSKYRKVHDKIKASEERVEGVVLRLENGQMVKVKTKWWLDTARHKYRRWLSEAQRDQEIERKAKKIKKMETQELRAVVKGLPARISPARLLINTGAKKVEAFYERIGGKRGAVILSFDNVAAKCRAMKSRCDFGVEISNAYGCRANSNAWHRVRTWYV